MPGAAVAIVVDDAPIYLKGFGSLVAGGQDLVTPDTSFGLASTTKAFAAATAALAVDEGLTTWDRPVAELIPGFRTSGGAAYEGIALRHMLSHRTGLARHDLIWSHNPDLTGEEIVRRLPFLAMQHKLGARYLYNNLMVMLAGHAVGLAYGMPWEEVLRTRILAPLGMARATTGPDLAAALGEAASGHRMDAERVAQPLPLRPEDRIGPAGCLHASARDLVPWLRLQLGGGSLDGARIVSDASMRAMHTGTAGSGDEDGEGDAANYALGWRVGSYKGLRRIEHGGNLHGYCSRIALYPERRAGLAILTNLRATPMATTLARDAADVLFGLERSNWSAKRLAARDAAEAKADERASLRGPVTPFDDAVDADVRARAVGEFMNAGYGPLSIAEDGSYLRLTYNGMGARMRPIDKSRFRAIADRPQDDDLDGLLFRLGRGKGEAERIEGLFDPEISPIAFTRTA